MSNKELDNKLREITIEDYIWIIYIGIIIISFISNYYEKNYYITKDILYKSNYRKTLIIIFSILIIVYLYFLKSSVNSLMNLKENDSLKKKRLVYLSFFASLLIAISGFIYLYIALVDDNIDVELAFN